MKEWEKVWDDWKWKEKQVKKQNLIINASLCNTPSPSPPPPNPCLDTTTFISCLHHSLMWVIQGPQSFYVMSSPSSESSPFNRERKPGPQVEGSNIPGLEMTPIPFVCVLLSRPQSQALSWGDKWRMKNVL